MFFAQQILLYNRFLTTKNLVNFNFDVIVKIRFENSAEVFKKESNFNFFITYNKNMQKKHNLVLLGFQ